MSPQRSSAFRVGMKVNTSILKANCESNIWGLVGESVGWDTFNIPDHIYLSPGNFDQFPAYLRAITSKATGIYSSERWENGARSYGSPQKHLEMKYLFGTGLILVV